jgi:TolA-binding protein
MRKEWIIAGGRSCLVVAVVALAVLSGCRSPLNIAALRSPLDDEPSIDSIKGPLERQVNAEEWNRQRQASDGRGQILEGLDEYETAEALYEAGDYRAAEKAFKQLVKARRRTQETWRSRVENFLGGSASKKPFGELGDPIEEDALFMVAECQFAQQRYSWAQDSFGELLERYPSTRHLDQATRRLFRIAQQWLQYPVSADEAEDVKLAKNEEGQPEWAGPAGGPASWPLVPNVTDRTRPVFDTHGRALQALEWIWRYDAAGPMADDALMLSATYNQRKGDYVEAARLYKLVRETYPDSSHLRDAYLLGSHVTLASYSGATYDGKTLQEAKQLKETTRRLFADLSPEQRQRLDDELVRVEQEEVEREWAKVQFYLRKNQSESVALYCHKIINKYPDSEYAARARQVLAEQTRSGPGRLGRFGNVLRPAERPPTLEPVEEGPAGTPSEEAPGRVALEPVE